MVVELIPAYRRTAKELTTKYNLPASKQDSLLGLVHFLGPKDAELYIKTYKDTGSYDKAQEAVNQSIVSRAGHLPKNSEVVKHIARMGL